MITRRTLIASLGAALAALMAMTVMELQRASGQGLVPGDPLAIAAGRALFEREWVGAPSSTDAADGLGPLFNAKSCNGCHRGGGAAQFAMVDGELRVRGLVVRLALPDGSPHPAFGAQIQDRALPGLEAEGRVSVSLENGMLNVTTILAKNAVPPALHETRIAPSLLGKSLLEEIDARAVLALADPGDSDGDGISGRPNFATDAAGNKVLGRFGSKAAAASLLDQTAAAAALDLGLSSPRVRRPHGDCTIMQRECLARPTGRSSLTQGEEISDEIIALMAAYVRSLDAPAVDMNSSEMRLFMSVGCGGCHRPEMPGTTGGSHAVFSDLLLHDIGGQSQSVIREGDALPAEWRTAPLRDLASRNGTRRYLHDGRAATLSEAIALHGGEAGRARSAFQKLDGPEQRMLIDFLSGL